MTVANFTACLHCDILGGPGRCPLCRPAPDPAAPDPVADPRPLLAGLIAFLAGRCDWAQSPDGVGFDKADTQIGHELSLIPCAEWDAEMLAWAYDRACAKYARQIDRAIGPGVAAACASLWPAPPTAPARADGSRWWERRRRAAKEAAAEAAARAARTIATAPHGRLKFAFPYDRAIVAQVRALPGARFDGATRSWTADLRATRALADLLPAFTVTDQAAEAIADRLADDALDARAAACRARTRQAA